MNERSNTGGIKYLLYSVKSRSQLLFYCVTLQAADNYLISNACSCNVQSISFDRESTVMGDFQMGKSLALQQITILPGSYYKTYSVNFFDILHNDSFELFKYMYLN